MVWIPGGEFSMGANNPPDMNPVGMNMAGNVWQWTSDLYRPDYYAKLAQQGRIVRNPSDPKWSLTLMAGFFAPISIVPAASLECVAKAKPAQERII
jgi:formylglycine-generating enzyme required for sulfatase activity